MQITPPTIVDDLTPEFSAEVPKGIYDENYYRSGCGPVSYERNEFWLGFFARIADEIARSLKPFRVLDAGCAMGFLVESLWGRGIETWGIDISAYAISKVRGDVEPYCRVGSLAEPISGTYDLVTCIEVLEHIPASQLADVIANFSAVTDTVLFSSTPSDFNEPTHVSVRPPLFWLRLFAEHGFQPDLLFDAGFLTPHAILFRKGTPPPEEVLVLFSRMILARSVLAALDNQVRALQQQNADLKLDKAKLESLQVQFNALSARNQELDSAHQELRQLKAEFDVLVTRNKTLEGAHEELELLQVQFDALTARNQELEGTHEKIEQLKAELDALALHSKGLEAAREERDQLKAEIESLPDWKKAIENADAELKQLQGKLDSLSESNRVLETANTELRAAMSRDREAARRELAAAAVRLAELKSIQHRTAELEKQTRHSQILIAELNGQNQAFDFEVAQLKRENNRLGSELHSLVTSPGWKLVEGYRKWLNKNIVSRPWLQKMYEPAVGLFLRPATQQPFSPVRQPDVTHAPSDPLSPVTASPVEQGAVPLPEGSVRLTFEQWIQENEPSAAILHDQRTSSLQFQYRPLISIVLPVYRVSSFMLEECIASVLSQTYDNWELCITHSAPENKEHRDLLATLASGDSRVKLLLLDENKGISGNSNAALELATGEFVAFLDHDDTLAPFAFHEVVAVLNVSPWLDVIYSDHDYIGEADSHRFNPLFKPDWSPEIMLSANYMTHLTVLRRTTVMEVGGFDTATDGAQDWDLFFKVTERTARIAHIPQLLYHWRAHAASTAQNTDAKNYAEPAQIHAIQSHLDRINLPGRIERDSSGLLHVRWHHPVKAKRVSIIIPSKDKVSLLSCCIRSLLEVTRYDDYEILIIDNGSTEPATRNYYNELAGITNIRVLDYPFPFNFSGMNNFGVKHATGELLLFLNNDVEVTSADWLTELVGWALVPDIGIVGAKLLRGNGAIQHAGVVVGYEGFAGHPFNNFPSMTFNMFGSTGWYRNFLAVTGACMMLRRNVFDDIGGFDETFISCGSDVEICLRTWQHNYRVIYNPFAELIHYECQTRKGEVPANDYFMSLRHYKKYLLNGDPFWNPNLSMWDPNMGFHDGREQHPLSFVQKFVAQLKGSESKSKPAPVLSAESSEESLLVSWFDYSPSDVQRSRELMASVSGFRRVRKVIWFIPPFENPFYGGIFTILRFAEAWFQAEGVINHFAICGSVTIGKILEGIRKVHPACNEQCVTILGSLEDVKELPEADAGIATLWTTAYYILKCNKAPRKYYFIQDFEPAFYRAGPASALVENTYRLGFYGIANTISLKKVYESEYGGKAAYFNPQVNLSVFHPVKSGVMQNLLTWRVVTYARPQHSRNAFESLASALRLLKSRLGSRVSIFCAGSEWQPDEYGLAGVVENLGLLEYEETAELYRSCHAGVVLMMTRHPSYIPLELMASGCLVVTNRNHWTGWLLNDEENCLLSDVTATCLATTIERGLTDHALRSRITGNALTLATERYSDWEPEISKIYQFLCNPEESATIDASYASQA